MSGRVLVAEPLSETGLAVLRAAGLVADLRTDLSRDALLGAIGEYDALAVRSETKVTAAVLEAAPTITSMVFETSCPDHKFCRALVLKFKMTSG